MKRDSVASLFHNNLFARSLRQRVAYFYAESNAIVGIFLRPLLKICIQIKWGVWNKNTAVWTIAFVPRFHKKTDFIRCLKEQPSTFLLLLTLGYNLLLFIKSEPTHKLNLNYTLYTRWQFSLTRFSEIFSSVCWMFVLWCSVLWNSYSWSYCDSAYQN